MATDAFVILDESEFDELKNSIVVPGAPRTFILNEASLHDEDAEGLVFSDGLAQIDTVYLEHPAEELHLIPAASFHRVVFEDKACEAIELASELGASRIEAEHLAGWGSEMAATFGFPIVGGGGARTSRTASRMLFAAEYEPNFQAPPPEKVEEFYAELLEHYEWLSFERPWETMVLGRLQQRLTRYSLLVTYESDRDVNAEFIGGIRKLGFSAGGSFVEFERTSWRLDVTF